jgi:hypothetical protein
LLVDNLSEHNPARKRFFIKLYVVISPSDAGFFLPVTGKAKKLSPLTLAIKVWSINL